MDTLPNAAIASHYIAGSIIVIDLLQTLIYLPSF